MTGSSENPSTPDDALSDLAKRLSDGDFLLGLDLGTKTIGLAVGSLGVGVATPLGTIRRTKFTQDCDTLKRLIAEREIAALVLGLPLNMDGSEGPRAQSTRGFARNLSKTTTV